MIVRKFRNSDAKSVSDLIRKCLIEINSQDYSKKVINFMCNRFTPERIVSNSKNGETFVAVENNKILGTVSLKENIMLTFFVDPKLHGKGVGTALIKNLEKFALENGCRVIRVPSSTTAYEFYKKFGYRKVETINSKNYGKIIMMKKKLIRKGT